MRLEFPWNVVNISPLAERNAAAEPYGIGVKTPTYWHLSTFDYILVSPQLAVRSMHTKDAKHRAPNASQGSDHFPVTAVLVWEMDCDGDGDSNVRYFEYRGNSATASYLYHDNAIAGIAPDTFL